MDRLRIRPKTAPFRRGGQVFTSNREFVEFDWEDLAPRQAATLLAERHLVIEIPAEGEGDEPAWTPVPEELREEADHALAAYGDEKWTDLQAQFEERQAAKAERLKAEAEAAGDQPPGPAKANGRGRRQAQADT